MSDSETQDGRRVWLSNRSSGAEGAKSITERERVRNEGSPFTRTYELLLQGGINVVYRICIVASYAGHEEQTALTK